MEPVEFREVWTWPTPKDGEIVPDHPPVDITGFLVPGTLTLTDEAGKPRTKIRLGASEPMDDLAEFLRARLDDEERVARAASEGGPWHYSDGDSVGAWTLYDEQWEIASLKTYRHETYDYATRMPSARHPRYVDADANGEHIARWDPARVLAEVEAKRRILDLHQRVDARDDWMGRGRDTWPPEPACYGCGADFQQEYTPWTTRTTARSPACSPAHTPATQSSATSGCPTSGAGQ